MIKYEVLVYENGTQEWSLNGRDHREDGPAVTYADGTEVWYLNGNILGGEWHREDGPAYTRTDGYKAWFFEGKRHRTDGPAIIRADGTKEWYLNGVEVAEEDVMGHKITIDGKEVTLSAESYEALKESINA